MSEAELNIHGQRKDLAHPLAGTRIKAARHHPMRIDMDPSLGKLGSSASVGLARSGSTVVSSGSRAATPRAVGAVREVIRTEGDAQQGVLENDDALVGTGEARM